MTIMDLGFGTGQQCCPWCLTVTADLATTLKVSTPIRNRGYDRLYFCQILIFVLIFLQLRLITLSLGVLIYRNL